MPDDEVWWEKSDDIRWEKVGYEDKMMVKMI